jgi:hypothetical protein
MQNQIKFDKLETEPNGIRGYSFDLATTAFYDSESFHSDDILSITVYTETSADNDLVCENCDSASAPYFWLYGHDMQSCLSHLPESSHTYILDYINSYFD